MYLAMNEHEYYLRLLTCLAATVPFLFVNIRVHSWLEFFFVI
jgi:hypothetical protein